MFIVCFYYHEGHEDNEGKSIERFMNRSDTRMNSIDKFNVVTQRFQNQLMTKKYQKNGGTGVVILMTQAVNA
ncbi:MAG TPA: hypothetical protein DCZ48_00720 [Methylococcaceae bacterium]|nr:hypothetical protein [Methylococcaceae bacterium]